MKGFLIIFLSFVTFFAHSQKVGLVFSGGGAKGIAHIGVLRALEEHNIPVDYITGTSMGAIIGGAYASGMSPVDIEKLVLSERFLGWINGEPEKGFNYFYHKSDDNPHFLRLNLSLDSTLNFQINNTLANDVSLNFALAEVLAQATAISKGNFDSLFIPLRVVAADILTQSEVILSKGSLSNALRASQTVPFFYTPIRVDGRYLFDGGVYNNFPVDVAQQEFNPDIIIGVNVSSKIFNEYPYGKDEEIIGRSLLLLMLLDKSDPTQINEKGIYIQPNLQGYSAFDFRSAKSLIDSGYAQTIRQINEIKSKISARREQSVVSRQRLVFTSKNLNWKFGNIAFEGFNSKQRKYIQRSFQLNTPNPMSFDKIKDGYFRLVSEAYFSNAYPNIVYDSASNLFQLKLTRRPQKNFQVELGGVIASRDISNFFLGFNYYHFNNNLLHAYAGFQLGNFYKSVITKVRLDFPFQFYLEPKLSYNEWNYLENDDLLKESNTPTVLKRINRNFGGDFGFPLAKSSKATISVEGMNNVDQYSNDDVFISSDTLDRLQLTGLNLGIAFTSTTLNRKQYASVGSAYAVSGHYYSVHEEYEPGTTSNGAPARMEHQWFKLKLSAEQYFNAGWFRPGYLVEAVFSNQPFFSTYTGTIINTPSFLPLPDSRTLLLQNFRSFNYFAFGLRNVFTIQKRIDIRLEGHLFKPFDIISEGSDQQASISHDARQIFFAGSVCFVHHSPIGPISLSGNYYDDKENPFGVLLHIGFLLFNKHPLE